MFIFLSKLLPIFVYPIGLIAILLVAALLLRRSQRLQRICVGVAFVILWISGNAWVPAMLTRSLEWQYLPRATYPQSEVIVVLGGTTQSALYPRPIVEIGASGGRLLYAAHLYHEGVAPNLLLTSGYIDWMGDRNAPANDMAEILQMLDVPADALWFETESRNTYENALFSRQILTEKGIDRITLVTSAMHMPRSVALFEKQGFEVIPAPAVYNLTQSDWDRLWKPDFVTQLFNSLPTVGNVSTTTFALKEYLGIFIYRLRGWL
jgi:uncharacterized SAM-binding protein YcdF (DUF218 family)